MIEPFAFWNLIQTALTASEKQSTPPPPQTEKNTPCNDEPKPTDEPTAERAKAESHEKEPPNACESYLLRHERLSKKHGKP